MVLSGVTRQSKKSEGQTCSNWSSTTLSLSSQVARCGQHNCPKNTQILNNKLLVFGSCDTFRYSQYMNNCSIIFVLYCLLTLIVKVAPLQVMKSHGDVDAMVRIYTATALWRGRVTSRTLDCLYPPGKAPSTHSIGGWVNPRISLDTKEWRKISTPPTPGIEPGPCRP